MLVGKVIAIIVAVNATTRQTETVPTMVGFATLAQCERYVADENLSFVALMLESRGYGKPPWSVRITCASAR